MRITRSTLLALLTITLIVLCPCQARVGKRGTLDDGSLRTGDVMAIDMNTLFDFSRVADMTKLQFSATQTDGTSVPTALGDVFTGIDTPFMSYTYKPETYTKAVLTKYIDDRSFVVISDDGKVVYEETSANGVPRNLENPKVFKLSFWGAGDIACHDVIPWGEDMSLLVIGCISRNPLLSENTIWLQIVQRSDFTPVSTLPYVLGADSDFRVFNKLSLLQVWATPAKGDPIPYLVVHDQGKSHYIPPSSSSSPSGQVSDSGYKTNGFTKVLEYFLGDVKERKVGDIVLNNTNFLLFDVKDNTFEYLDEYTLDADTSKFDQVYDYFWIQNTLLVTSYIDGKSVFNISTCNLQIAETRTNGNDPIKVTCSDHSPTGVTNGFVTKIHGSTVWAYVEFEKDATLTVTVWNTHEKANPNLWAQLYQMTGIVQPADLDHKWIRSVQGNAVNLVIKYTSMVDRVIPAATKDTDSVLVAHHLGLGQNFPGWSANVHDNNIYYALIDSPTVAVARISGAWWKVTGDQLGVQITNEVTISCQEPGANAVSLTAVIRQGLKPYTIDISNWTPPYMDMFQNSIFRVPFDDRSYTAGNDLTFMLDTDDDDSFTTQVKKSQIINYSFQDPQTDVGKKMNRLFKEKNDSSFANIQFVTGGGAATVTYDGKLQVYGCDSTTHVCQGILNPKIDIKGDPKTEIFYKGFGGDNVQIYANTFAAGGLKHYGQTYFYVSRIVGNGFDTQTFNVEYAANDIAFSEDVKGNVYITLSYVTGAANPDEPLSFVDVYKIGLDDITKLVPLVKLTYTEILAEDVNDFCPTQVQFDPADVTMVHIMSDCLIKGYQYSRKKLFSYRTRLSPDFANKSALSFDFDPNKEFNGIAKFCPFEKNFLIYSIEANIAIAIDKRSSLSLYQIPLAAYGMTNYKSFDCMSTIGMYAIAGSANGNDELYNYGIFYGNKGYNDDKFVATVLKDQAQGDYLDARSFQTDESVLTVSYKSEGQTHAGYTVLQTLIRAPIMTIVSNNLDKQLMTSVDHKITVTASHGKLKVSKDATLTSIKQNQRLFWKGLKPWTNENYRIYVERYTRILGPVTSITVSGDQIGALSFKDRKKSSGGLNPTKNQIVLDVYRGSTDRGFGLTWSDQSETTTFSLIHNHDITAQFDLPLVFNADFCDTADGKRLVIASMSEGSGYGVHAFIVDDAATQVSISQSSTRTRGDKLRILSMKGNFYGMGLDKTTNVLSIWQINVGTDDIAFQIITHVQNVQDFDPANSNDTIYLYFIQFESSVGSLIILTPTDKGVDVSNTSTIPFNIQKPYWLRSIACNNKSIKTGAVCAFNTFGTVIYAIELPFNKSMLEATVFQTYNKLAGFDGDQMFITEDYIVQRAFNMLNGQLSVYAHVWCRLTYQFNNELHTQIQINKHQLSKANLKHVENHLNMGRSLDSLGERKIKSILNGFGTMAMTYYFDSTLNRSLVGVGSADKNVGLLLFSIYDSFSFFNNPEMPLDLSTYTISKEGAGEQGISLKQMLNDDVPSPTSSSSTSQSSSESSSSSSASPTPEKGPWLYVGLIGGLILLAIVFVAWTSSQKKVDEEEEDGSEGMYKTVDDKGTKFESGLTTDAFQSAKTNGLTSNAEEDQDEDDNALN